jgi:hypothetical protein
MRQDFQETSQNSVTPKNTVREIWPDAVAYREAIQQPTTQLGDMTLRGASVRLDRLSLPLAYSGRFAVVFRLNAYGNDYALRCFTTPGDSRMRAMRFTAIAANLARPEVSDLFVPFRYVERGIQVGKERYPTLSMIWAKGTPLGKWVEKNRANPVRLRNLANHLPEVVARLEGAGLAHGDWQHDNLLINDDGTNVTLVDYDGMFIPELGGHHAPELGHPNYQHPRRNSLHFAPGLDRFACEVIQTGLLALAFEPNLWAKYASDEAVLFRRDDYLNPDSSRLIAEIKALAELNKSEELAEHLAQLIDYCKHDPTELLLPLPPIVARMEDALSFAPEVPANVKIDYGHEPQAFHAPSDKSWIHNADIEGSSQGNLSGGKFSQVYTNPPIDEDWWKNVATAGQRISQMQAQAQATPFTFAMPSGTLTGQEFIDRLNDPTFAESELKHIKKWRFAPYILSILLIWSLFFAYKFITDGAAHFFPFFIFLFWHPKLMGMGYNAWPRKQIADELNARLEKIIWPIEQRRNRLQNLKSRLPQATTTNHQTLGDFQAEYLGSIPITRAIGSNIPLKAVEALQDDGITNALELQNRKAIAGVPPNQMEALRRWVGELEVESANQYRLLRVQGAISPNATNAAEPEQAQLEQEIDRFEQEMAVLEEELMRLEEQKAEFPPVSFMGYLKTLLGRN